MTKISLVATDQLLTIALQPKIASGDQNSVTLHIEFDEEWSGCGRSAVFFTSEDSTVYEIPLVADECTIPHEVLSRSGILYIGARGVNSSNKAVKTSTLVKYKIAEGAPCGTGTTVEPTADVYQQILTAYGKTDSAITKEKEERQAEIAVERKRINNLIAMGTNRTQKTYEIEDTYVSGKVVENGATAYIEITFMGKTLASYETYECSPLPECLAPLGLTYLSTAMSDNLVFSIDRDPATGVAVICVENASGEPWTAFAVASGSYPLATVSLSEITDARLGYDGTIYDTAGEAIRAQIIKLLNEKNATVIDLENYSPVVANVSASNGNILDPSQYGYARVTNEDLIPVQVGDKITTLNGYLFNVLKFNKDAEYTGGGTYGYTEYTVDWDGYLRLAIGLRKSCELKDYSPAVGSVATNYGTYAADINGVPYKNRVVNKDLIPVKVGDKITSTNGYKFNVFKWNTNGIYTGNFGTYGYTDYTVDWNGYVRLAVGLDGYDDLTDYVDKVCESVHLSNLVDVNDLTDYVDEAGKCTIITRPYDVAAEIEATREEIDALRDEKNAEIEFVRGEIDELREEINTADTTIIEVAKIANYNPAVGSVTLNYGDYSSVVNGVTYTNRVVNKTLIPVKVGYKITASKGYAFNVLKFNTGGTYTGEHGTYGYTEYTVDWDGYLRIAIGLDGYNDLTDYVDEACESVSIIEEVNNSDINTTYLQRKLENIEKRKYLFNFPYNLNHLYVCDYEDMEDLKDTKPTDFHAKMEVLCTNSNGYLSRTQLGEDAWGNALYKYVFEPNVPRINCSRNESAGRTFDGKKIDTPTVIILSGIHGLEASNDYAVYNFLKNLLTNRNEALDFIFRNLRLVFVPAICVTGLSVSGEGQYRNNNNINLNRAFPSTKGAEPYVTVNDYNTVYDPNGTLYADEVKCVMNVIDDYSDAIALVDMHTHKTYDVMSWNYTDDEVFKYVATRVTNDLTNNWLDKYPDVEFDTVNKTHDPATKVWVYHSANVAGTSSTYASKVHGIPAGTIEARRKMPMTNIHHGKDAVAYSYDMLVNFIVSFCRTIA